MREYWILTKLQLSSMYGINKIRHARDDDSKKKAKRSLFALIAMVLGLTWASTIYSLGLAMAFRSMGRLVLLPGLMAAAAGALVLVFSVFEAKGVLFGFGDYDAVMSWPVRVSAIVAARTTVMYAYNLVYALLLMLPAGAIYAVNAHPPLWFYPAYLVGMLTIPALPTVLGAAVGSLMAMATARMRHKNLAASFGQIALAFGIMALSFSMNSGMEGLAEKASSLGESVGRIWPPAMWFMRAVQGDVPMLLLSVLVSALALGAFALLLSGRFLAVNGRLMAVPHGKARRIDMRHASGAVRALYRMEWRRYTGSSLYLANTAFGYVLLLALAVVLGIVRPAVLNEIFADPSYPAMRLALPLIVSMIVTMSATTDSSISIEGKRLWIVKSLPVRARDWLAAKVLVSVTLAVPSILVCGVIISLGMRLPASEWVWMLVTPVSYALLSAAMGLTVNLRLPKFDWAAEAEIVKQSAAVGICVFAGMAAAGIPIAVLLTTGAAAVLPAATLLAFALSALLFACARRGGDDRLYRL